jgi:hypothetical protein
MKSHDFSQIEDYFNDWYSPKELSGMLRRIAVNYTLAALQAGNECMCLKEDLEDLNVFINHVDKVVITTNTVK